MKRKDYNDDSMRRFDRFNPIMASDMDRVMRKPNKKPILAWDMWDNCYSLGDQIVKAGEEVEKYYTGDNRLILENGADEVVNAVIKYIDNTFEAGSDVLWELGKRSRALIDNPEERRKFSDNVSSKFRDPDTGDAYLYIMKKIYEACEERYAGE